MNPTPRPSEGEPIRAYPTVDGKLHFDPNPATILEAAEIAVNMARQHGDMKFEFEGIRLTATRHSIPSHIARQYLELKGAQTPPATLDTRNSPLETPPCPPDALAALELCLGVIKALHPRELDGHPETAQGLAAIQTVEAIIQKYKGRQT